LPWPLPLLLIADEPTTDVTVQKRNHSIIERYSARNGNEYHFISHDLSLFEIAHRVLVMYQGEIVEQEK
jgi:peptide/nickel transport system ATP-binding protein